jgi:integrase
MTAKVTQKTLPARLRDRGRHPVAGRPGLYLKVLDPGRRAYWTFRYRVAGKQGETSLGPYPEVSLDQAREQAALLHGQVKGQKADPLAGKRAARAKQTEAPTIPTFGEAAEQYIDAKAGNWGNDQYRRQWRTTILGPAGFAPSAPGPRPDHCPLLRPMRVDEIAVDHVLRVLAPIWESNKPTAAKLRGRIEEIISYARVRFGFDRDRLNPAVWKGNLDHLLSRPRKRGQVRHLPALPYVDIPSFMAQLRDRGDKDVGARALEFLILTAVRSNEVLGATWNEIDLDAPGGAVWTIPASRMKMKAQHRVPLSDRAVEILRAQLEARPEGARTPYVFPGIRPMKPLSRAPLVALTKKLSPDVTVHGFRSSFRDWASVVARADEAAAERCLAHVIGNDVRRAYARDDLIDLRRPLMQSWAAYCGGEALGEKVIPMRRRG